MGVRTLRGVDGTELASGPSAPPSGRRLLYPKADGWYEKDSTGVETRLGASGPELMVTTDYTDTNPSSPSTGLKLFSRSRARRIPSFVGPTGQDSQLQPAVFTNRVVWWQARNGDATESVWGHPAFTVAGTGSAVSTAAGSFYGLMVRKRFATSALTNSGSGVRTTAQWLLSTTPNAGGFFMVVRFGLNTGASGTRGFIGLSSTTTALAPGTNPTALLNLVGFGWNSGQTTLRFMSNDASGAATAADLGANFPVTTGASNFYEVRLFAPSGAGQQVYYSAHRLNDGVVVTGGPVTTDLPALDTLLAAHVHLSSGTVATAQSVDVQSVYVETDN